MTDPNTLYALGTEWSIIPQTLIYLEKLRLLSHSEKELRLAGYVTIPLSPEAIELKKRCRDCGGRLKKKPNKPKAKREAIITLYGDRPASDQHGSQHSRHRAPAKPGKEKEIGRLASSNVANADMTPAVNTQRAELLIPDLAPLEERAIDQKQTENPWKKPVCQFHPGKVYRKNFTCCQRHLSSPGCATSDHHTPLDHPPHSLERDWQFHPTPTPPSNPHPHSHPASIRPAITLDCEMGTTTTSTPELIRLTALDFFTGAPLLNTLVSPLVPMQHYNTRYSGVSASDMRAAIRHGTCLYGRDAAREQLWRFVGPETIVVVHGGQGDLSALRWVHGAVVDTGLVEARFGPAGVVGGRSLKNLAWWRVGRRVQVQGQGPGGRVGHCSYEDALACRELAHWHVGLIPDG